MNNQDDFFFQNFHGILEEKVLLEYLQHAQKHKKLMKLLPAILCFSTRRPYRRVLFGKSSAFHKCPKKLRVLTCSLRAFCFSSLRFVLNCARNGTILLHSGRYAPKKIYSLADVQLLVGFAKGINKLVIQDVLAQIEKEQIPLKAKEKVQWLRVKVGIEKEESSY